jgi:hypothetical protein
MVGVVEGGLFFTRLSCTVGPVSAGGRVLGLDGGLSPPEPEEFQGLSPLGVGLCCRGAEPTVVVIPLLAGAVG